MKTEEKRENSTIWRNENEKNFFENMFSPLMFPLRITYFPVYILLKKKFSVGAPEKTSFVQNSKKTPVW